MKRNRKEKKQKNHRFPPFSQQTNRSRCQEPKKSQKINNNNNLLKKIEDQSVKRQKVVLLIAKHEQFERKIKQNLQEILLRSFPLSETENSNLSLFFIFFNFFTRRESSRE